MKYVLMNYTIQCKDENSGKTGYFLFDLDRYATEGKFFALSEVYPDLEALYSNTTNTERKSCYVEFQGSKS